MRKAKKNAQWLEWLQEMRDEEEPDSNKYMVYNKAFNSLKKVDKGYHDPEALLEVKFIGAGIIQRLKKLWEDAGGIPAMGVIPSNQPSPVKPKRGSGATSSSTSPKKRGRPPKQPLFEEVSDEEGNEMPAQKRLAGLASSRQHQPSNLPAPNVPSAFAAPHYPLGVPPQMHRPHVNPNRQMAHHLSAPQFAHNNQHYGYPPPPALAYQQSAAAGASHFHPAARDLALPSPHEVQSIQPFSFHYLDSDRKRVRSRDMAAVDIHDSALWYKVCFLDFGTSRLHPLRQRLRCIPVSTRKGKRREELVEAWVSDQDVERHALHTAPGFTQVEDVIDLDPDSIPSGITSQTATHVQRYNMGEASARNKGGGTAQWSREESLSDLLKAESKKKRSTIDPTRNMDVDKEWDMRRGGQRGVVKTEKTGGHQENASSEEVTMRHHLAMAAMARQQPLSTITGRSPAETGSLSSQPAPSSSTANPAIRRTNTLPGSTSDLQVSQNMARVPTSDSFQFDPVASALSAISRYVAPPTLDVESQRTVTAPAILLSAGTVPKPKPKPKGRVRGRVSEFASALPAVDEFDIDLDRQAARQHTQAEQHASASVSHASADLIDDVTDLTTEAAPIFPVFDPIIFSPNSYEIALVLDNREVKSHKHRDYIASELRKKGVNVFQRSLALGDVLWIAKRKWPVADAVDNECVLDYILERKRLDDLCGSIKEGRFHEQKFRLANTGLKVFYLIEEYDVEKNREYFGVQIDTARSSVQIVDGFILKETTKLSYTIDYLTTMHQTIVEMYQHQALYVIPPHLIKRHSYMALQKHLRQNQPTMGHLTSYTCFERLNSKSANLTTRDLLAQMLLCVKGLSGEKTARIIDKYPTVRSLWEAFRVAEAVERDGREAEAAAASQGNKGEGRKKKSTVPQAKAMLCELEASGRKRIGPVLSRNVYRLMRANAYEE